MPDAPTIRRVSGLEIDGKSGEVRSQTRLLPEMKFISNTFIRQKISDSNNMKKKYRPDRLNYT